VFAGFDRQRVMGEAGARRDVSGHVARFVTLVVGSFSQDVFERKDANGPSNKLSG